ncbi:serine protease [Stemphylium lycopersici]|uniref:Subtilisin-like protein n=1 Tax=Stemphylium lycopersici TaxID=183478 RepID=A0A364MWE3_STELY|nr:serine protease [Stemphylium lycopersici]RAR05583.1 subtilisin-like protein [Stemphylium lycopersici]
MSSHQTSQPSTSLATIPTGDSLEAIIGNVTYQLPSSDEDSTEVMLGDGSLAQLFADKIVMESQTVTVPSDLTSTTALPGGVTAKLGEATVPEKPDSNDDDNSGGSGGLFGALGGIASGATSALGGAIDGIGSVSSGALAFARGAGGAATDLSSPLSGAIGHMGKVISSFNGIQKAFTGNELTKEAFETLTGAHTLGRQSLNWMRSTQSLTQDFSNLPADVKSKVQFRAGEFVKPGGVLDQCKEALEKFQDFPWNEADESTHMLEPSATSEPTGAPSLQSAQGVSTENTAAGIQSSAQSETSRMSSSQTTASSSETPTPTAPIKNVYGILSKDGTPWPVFKEMIESLDGGKGPLVKWDNIQSQLYLAEINATQAQEVAESYDFINWIGIHDGGISSDDEETAEEFRAIDTLRQQEPNLPKLFIASDASVSDALTTKDHLHHYAARKMGPPISEAPWWKKMLSAPPSAPDDAPLASSDYPDYMADETGGAGTIIYILDDGFDTETPDLLPHGRKIETHFVPNKYTIPPSHLDRGVPENIRGPASGSHGTIMASLAGGLKTGVAPKADLHLFKVKGQYRHREPSTSISTTHHTELAIGYWTEHIKNHIEARGASRQKGGPEVKSVINMSWGIKLELLPPPKAAEITRLLQEFLDYCQQNHIPVVVAAGNTPHTMDVNENAPQRFSKPEDSMVIVGGVDHNGQVIKQQLSDQDGLVHVYSPGADIEAPIDATNFATESGTSQAAAIVSGLIAYYNGLPNLQVFEAAPPGGVVGAKGMLRSHAWPRSSPESSIKVVYNLARGDPAHSEFSCVQRRGVSGKRDDEGICTFSSTMAISASSTASSESLSANPTTPPATPSFSSSSSRSPDSLVSPKSSYSSESPFNHLSKLIELIPQPIQSPKPASTPTTPTPPPVTTEELSKPPDPSPTQENEKPTSTTREMTPEQSDDAKEKSLAVAAIITAIRPVFVITSATILSATDANSTAVTRS